MKRIIWLLVLVAAGYAVWKYYPEIERIARERTGVEQGPKEGRGIDAIPDSLPGSKPSGTRDAVAPSQAVSISRPDEAEIAKKHPMPQFKPIEELVGGWKKIPASAFPRQVTLKAPATLKLTSGVGTSVVEAGRTVYALASTPDGALVIAPAPDAVMRGTVPMASTDFQAILEAVYEQFKKRVRAEVEQRREAARLEAAQAAGSVAVAVVGAPQGESPSAETLAAIGPKPRQNEDLTVPIVEASIAERQRTRKHAEPPADAKLGWRAIHYREIGGKPYWVTGVRYTARTIFGEFPAEALALIRHNKVERWIYAGTGEPLP
ncbi:MAG: hypothetical protein ACKV19_14395 [Verrucomicrobiales bacterium]